MRSHLIRGNVCYVQQHISHGQPARAVVSGVRVGTSDNGTRTNDVCEALATVLAALEAEEALEGAEEAVLVRSSAHDSARSARGDTHPCSPASTEPRRLLAFALLGRAASRGGRDACTVDNMSSSVATDADRGRATHSSGQPGAGPRWSWRAWVRPFRRRSFRGSEEGG